MAFFHYMILTNILLGTFSNARPQNVEWQNSPHVIGLPYYGGAKGQLLQITTDQNGAILNQAIVPETVFGLQQNTPIFFQHQTPMTSVNEQFSESFNNLQSSAQRLVQLQQKVKQNGQLRDTDKVAYKTNLALLGQSASTLAELESQDGQDLATLLSSQLTFNDNKNPPNNRNGFEQADTQGFEEDVGEESAGGDGDGTGDGAGSPDDTVQINGPSDTASVAEAKPVGVAIAGEGGVASSKPAATAIVGPGGLAIARPVATAISGVDPNSVGFAQKIPVVSSRKRADALLAKRTS